MKKFIYITLWPLFIAIIGTLLAFVDNNKNELLCTNFVVSIDHSDGNFFVMDEDVTQVINRFGYRGDSMLLSVVNTRQLEYVLNTHPSVKSADVYTTIDGRVKIEICQRKPVLRVFTQSGESYYIDDSGMLMPLSSKYTARVPVAGGNISDSYTSMNTVNVALPPENPQTDSLLNNSVLDDLYRLVNYVRQDEFWKAQITQIYVNNEREMELIPRVGNHTILLGDVNDLDEKFGKLMIFYKKALPVTGGWNVYSLVNLKYKNQVVCRK